MTQKYQSQIVSIKKSAFADVVNDDGEHAGAVRVSRMALLARLSYIPQKLDLLTSRLF